MPDLNVSYMSIEIWVAALAILTLMLDLFVPRESKGVIPWIAAGGLLLAFIASCVTDVPEKPGALFGLFLLDGFSLFFKRIFAIIGIFILIMSRGYVQRLEARAQGEFTALSLFALLGMFLVSSAGDLMSLFVCLETITISFYVLVSFKRSDPLSVEAGLKYIILGALASSFLLFGIALVYGATGQVTFAGIQEVLAATAGGDAPILGRVDFLLGVILIITGLGFKIAAVPFHIWAPDVYMGAPTPITAFLSVGSKAAGFVLMLRVISCVGGVVPLPGDVAGAAVIDGMQDKLALVLSVLAAITVFYGNLAAIPQRNIKRLLGYSTIGHAGYLIMGLAAMNRLGTSAVLYYILGYVFTNLAAFIVIIIFSASTKSHALESYCGLSKRSPLLAACLTISMLSLAGIPPLAGFFGKFLVIAAVLEDHFWLACVGAVNVVISMYYYLCVIKRMYVSEPTSDEPIVVPGAMKAALLVCIVLIFVIGIVQGPFMEMTESVAKVIATY